MLTVVYKSGCNNTIIIIRSTCCLGVIRNDMQRLALITDYLISCVISPVYLIILNQCHTYYSSVCLSLPSSLTLQFSESAYFILFNRSLITDNVFSCSSVVSLSTSLFLAFNKTFLVYICLQWNFQGFRKKGLLSLSTARAITALDAQSCFTLESF